MECTVCSAQLQGKKGEDRIVAVRRAWPLPDEDGQPGAEQEEPATPISNFFQASVSSGGGSRLKQHRRQDYTLLAVFDGHNSAAAARFAARAVVPVLECLLPPFPRGDVSLAAEVQEALTRAVVELHRQFAKTGCRGGCSATLVLQVGPLVTCASAGSSRCLLDTGAEVLQLSAEHRVSSNEPELQRLRAAGCHVAPVNHGGNGPAQASVTSAGRLRLWPGGLTLSRSIGDFAIGEGLIPLPHIVQVLLPPSGGRLILASDGLWSQLPGDGTAIMHEAPVQTLAHQLIQAVSGSEGRSGADVSVVCADVLPPQASWQATLRRLASSSLPDQQQRQQGRQPGAPGSKPQQQEQQRPTEGSEFGEGTTVAAAAASAGKRMLQMLGLRKSSSDPSLQLSAAQPAASSAAGRAASGSAGKAQRPGPAAAAAGGPGVLAPPSAKLLMDVDTAALMGLLPAGTASISPVAASRNAAGSGSEAAGQQASTGSGSGSCVLAQGEVPVWWDEDVKVQLESALRDAHLIWHAVQRRKAAADRLHSLSSDRLDLLAARHEQQAARARAAGALLQPSTPAGQEAGGPQASPFGQPGAQDEALRRRGGSLELAPAAAGAGKHGRQVPVRQQSLPANLGAAAAAASRAGSLRSILKKKGGGRGGAAVEGEGQMQSSSSESDDSLLAPASATVPKRVSFCASVRDGGEAGGSSQPELGTSTAAGRMLPLPPPPPRVRTAAAWASRAAAPPGAPAAAGKRHAPAQGTSGFYRVPPAFLYPLQPDSAVLTNSPGTGTSTSTQLPATPSQQQGPPVTGAPAATGGSSRWLAAHDSAAGHFTSAGSRQSQRGRQQQEESAAAGAGAAAGRDQQYYGSHARSAAHFMRSRSTTNLPARRRHPWGDDEW